MHHFHLDIHRIHIIKSEVEEVYLNLIIQSFAISLIFVFVPIYLLKLGYSLNQALAFIMVQVGMQSFFSPVSGLLAKRFGFKHIILYRAPLVVAYFLALYALSSVRIPIYIIAVAGGLADSVYWVSLHALFAKHSDKFRRGSQTGKMMSLPGIAALFGPSIGGIIALNFGFKVLFAVAILFFFASLIPLFSTGDMKPHAVHFSLQDVFARKHLKFWFKFIMQGSIEVTRVAVWPLFVYLTLKNVASVGFMATTTAVGIILFTLYIGGMADKVSKSSLFKAGGFFLALAFLLMIYATNPIRIFSISFALGIFIAMIEVPFLALFYDKANKGNLTEYMVLRQMALGIGRVGSLLLLLFVFNKFTVGFSLGSIASLIFGLF